MTSERSTRSVGFRGRVLGLCAVLLVTALAVGLVVERAVLIRRHGDEVERSLALSRAEVEQLSAGVDPATGEPFVDDAAAVFEVFLARNVPAEGEVYLTFVAGEPFLATAGPDGAPPAIDDGLLERWARSTVGERSRAETDAGTVEYLSVPVQRDGETLGVFVAVSFVDDELAAIDAAIRTEALVSLVVLVVVLAVAWWLAGRLLRPVRRLTDTARSISDSDLTARIPVTTDDEIGELAATFNDMLDRLEEAFESQRRFVDDAGHELRTPITIVRGQLEVMGDDPADRRETVALVTDELDRMARIVNDLLLLAKAEQPDFVVARPVELSDVTTDLFVKATQLGDRRWELDGAAVGTVPADVDRVTQAVLNLARNAVEHTGRGDVIGLGSSIDGTTARLWVRDSGPGVPESERPHVFDRFRRGADRPRASDGAGLGLSIVRAVAVAHGGHVSIGSSNSGGALFTIELPAATSEAIERLDDVDPGDSGEARWSHSFEDAGEAIDR